MTGAAIKVLVVDDIASNLIALQAVLDPLGVEVVRATSGPGAVAMVETHAFAVAILDVMMPEMDGFETARCIRQQDRGRSLPIILLTAYEFALPQIRAAYASGVADFIFKPFDADILRSKVAVFVELFRKNRIERERDEARARAVELKHMAHLKDEFLATLSHELRNPLASLLSATETLVDREPADGGVRARLHGTIRRQVVHLCALVEDSLEISRFTQGKIRVRREALDLREVLGNAMELAQAAIDHQSTQVSVSLPAEPVRVQGDPVRLAQVISNLLDNAAKFTPRGGQVWVTLEATRDQAVVRVRDAGCGIAPAQIARIFQPFVQARPGEGARDGLGIGLALAKRLIELHGGTIDASSPGVGHGAELVVGLPIDHSYARSSARAKKPARPAGGAEPRSPSPATPPAPAPARSRVLVVDDNPEIRGTLQVFLQLEGHTVETVDCGRAALDRIRETNPDVVLLDIDLPDLDGFAVAEQVRVLRGAAAPRLIAMTGAAGPREKVRALRAGFDAHLSKPVDGRSLLRTIAGS
jgi:signal transduction histidine kinase